MKDVKPFYNPLQYNLCYVWINHIKWANQGSCSLVGDPIVQILIVGVSEPLIKKLGKKNLMIASRKIIYKKMWVDCNTPKILRINLQSTLNSRVRQLDNETLMPCLDLRGRGKVKESKVELTKNRLIFGSNLLLSLILPNSKWTIW